jgi:hypothetical protein
MLLHADCAATAAVLRERSMRFPRLSKAPFRTADRIIGSCRVTRRTRPSLTSTFARVLARPARQDQQQTSRAADRLTCTWALCNVGAASWIARGGPRKLCFDGFVAQIRPFPARRWWTVPFHFTGRILLLARSKETRGFATICWLSVRETILWPSEAAYQGKVLPSWRWRCAPGAGGDDALRPCTFFSVLLVLCHCGWGRDGKALCIHAA